MKTTIISLIPLSFLVIFSCHQRKMIEDKPTNYAYYDKPLADTISREMLLAVSDKGYLQNGVNVAYVNQQGDTVIPFGKYLYLGTDTFKHFAQVVMPGTDTSDGGWVAIDQSENILYHIVPFDLGPDPFREGLVRAVRNGKMGFANKYGQVIIPCKYDHAYGFEDGKATVTHKAIKYLEHDDHMRIDSDEWFYIDKEGNRVE